MNADRGLPPLLVLTDRRAAEAAGRTLAGTVAGAVRGGARWVVLREKDLAGDARTALAYELRAVLDPVGGRLIVASGRPADTALARRADAAGVHLARAEPPPRDRTGLVVGRSCHDAAELARAVRLGADYVTVSPVFATASKPGYGPALGPGGLAGLVRGAPGCPPVFALGGVTERNAAACRPPAYGVAVMGAIMGADDPAGAARGLLRALA